MPELPLLRFIPFRRADIRQMCRDEGSLAAALAPLFERGCADIEKTFAGEFAAIKRQLKDAYAPLDPDADTREVEAYRQRGASDLLAQELAVVLDRANYERVSEQALQRAFRDASMFQLRLDVDLEDFDEVLLLSLIQISEPTRRACRSRMPSSA